MHLIVQASRLSDGSRRITHISEITGTSGEIVSMQDIFVFEKTGLTPQGKVTGRFRGTGIVPRMVEKLNMIGAAVPLQAFEEVVEV